MITTNRRHLLFAAAGLTGVALAAPRGAAAAGVATARGVRRLDFSDPRTALESYVKLRGSTRDETVWQPYGGDIFAIRDGEVGIPLAGFWGLQKSRWKKTPDDAYVNEDYDLGFYVDYRTRKILERWTNPITGEDVQVYHYRGGPSGGRFAVGSTGHEDPYSRLDGRWNVVGDQVWYTSSVWGERPNTMPKDEFPEAWSGDKLRNSMSTTYVGSLAALADPNVHQVPGPQVWSNTSSWQAWMRMGARPGYSQWRWVGAKGAAVRDLDPALAEACERAWPGYVTKDAGWKTPTAGTPDYMRLKRGLPVTD